MPTLTQLKYIIAVDQEKSFSRAAQTCNVSQPSLSAQIQKVEDLLGFMVFDRSKKPILATAKGRSLLQKAQVILKEHAKLYDIQTELDILSGSFNLAIIPSLAPYLLPLFLEGFSKKYPRVELKVSELKTEEIQKSLYEDQIDAALLVTPLQDDKLSESPLFYEKFFAYCSTNHSLFKKKILSEQDLELDSIWLLEEGHCFRNQVMRVCSASKELSPSKNIKFESGNLETLINLVREGQGYTLLPELAIRNLPQKEKEQRLKKFRSPIPTREVSLVQSRKHLKQDVIEALKKELLLSLPKEVKSTKKSKVDVVDI